MGIGSLRYYDDDFISYGDDPQPAAGEITVWWSKVFTYCPPYATML